MLKQSLTTIGAIVALSFMASGSATAADGNVNFIGEVTDAPCTVAPDSRNMIIDLGQVRTSDFATAGVVGDIKTFHINLEHCDIATLSNASVQFDGVASPLDTELLGLNSTSKADNMAIEFLDNSGNSLPIGTPAPTQVLSAGNTALVFGARYKSTGTATAGQATADSTFTITYS